MITGTLISIDPGTEFLGISVITYDYETHDPITIESRTLDSKKIHCPLADDIEEIHGHRIANVFRMTYVFKEILAAYKPNVVVSEYPFFHRLHASAFGPLVETVFALRDAVIEYDPYIPFIIFAPTVIKKTLTGKAFAKKPEMKQGVLANEKLMKAIRGEASKLSPDAIDSIGVGFTYLEKYKGV